jgi:amidase
LTAAVTGSDLAYTPALEQARLVREGEVSPVEFVDAYLARIEELNPTLNAYITVAGDQARAAAKEAEKAVAASGAELPPFHGVTVSVKDLIDTAGIRTTYATAAWADRVPDADAAVVAKLRTAGFIILGKTNTPEFAGGIYTEPTAYGPCRNPWNPEYSPGGSSGGAGSAQAAGLCAAALGSDDGGSIRIPSGWSGLFGIKPSRGRVSAAPEPSTMYYTPGPMTHTVADGAAILDAIAGDVPGDAFWAPPPARPFREEVGRDPGSLRIGYTTRGADHVETAPGNAAAVVTTARTLEKLGHRVEELGDWPGRGAFPGELPVHFLYAVHFAALIDDGRMPPADRLEPGNAMLVDMGRQTSAADIERIVLGNARASREIVRLFEDVDVLLTPIFASQPSRIGEYIEAPERALELLDACQFTGQFSVTGQPAVAVPAGLDDDGIPVGVQLVGRPADEATLLRVAAQLEDANPWIDRHPRGC